MAKCLWVPDCLCMCLLCKDGEHHKQNGHSKGCHVYCK